MKQNKYIHPRYSAARGKENEITAYVVCYPYLDEGVRHTITRNFPLKNFISPAAALMAAEKERDRIIKEVKKNCKQGSNIKLDYTVADLFELSKTHFPRTVKSQRKNQSIYDKYIGPFCGDMNILDVTLEQVQLTLIRCAKSCVQQQVRNVKTDWHRIYQTAQIKGLPVIDFTTVLDTPKSDKVSERSLSEQNITEDDFQKVCEFMSEYGHYMPEEADKVYNRDILLRMLKLMRITGMRPQEAKALRRADIVFDEVDVYDAEKKAVERRQIAQVRIYKSVGSTMEEMTAVKNTKTPQSVRAVPVFEDGVELLKETLQYSKYDYIYSKYNGEPFDSDEVSDYLHRVSRACGIKVYAGLMRKSFAADQYRAKTNPAAIKKMMGHKSENMSVTWYATAADDEILTAIATRKYKN